eukprot:2609382-Pyramimonas_sp.AAC.1
MKLRGDEVLRAQEWSHARGRKSFITAAGTGPDGGPRSGVGIFGEKQQIGATLLASFLDTCTLLPSHAAAIMVHRGMRHGFVAVSACMEQGLRLSGDNVQRLQTSGSCLAN